MLRCQVCINYVTDVTWLVVETKMFCSIFRVINYTVYIE